MSRARPSSELSFSTFASSNIRALVVPDIPGENLLCLLTADTWQTYEVSGLGEHEVREKSSGKVEEVVGAKVIEDGNLTRRLTVTTLAQIYHGFTKVKATDFRGCVLSFDVAKAEGDIFYVLGFLDGRVAVVNDSNTFLFEDFLVEDSAVVVKIFIQEHGLPMVLAGGEWRDPNICVVNILQKTGEFTRHKQVIKAHKSEYVCAFCCAHYIQNEGVIQVSYLHEHGQKASQRYSSEFYHSDAISSLVALYNMATIKYLASTSKDGSLIIWDVKSLTKQSKLLFKSSINTVTQFAPSETPADSTRLPLVECEPVENLLIVIGLDSGELALLSFSMESKELSIKRWFKGFDSAALFIRVFPGNERLVAAHEDGRLTFWNLFKRVPGEIKTIQVINVDKTSCVLQFDRPEQFGSEVNEYECQFYRLSNGESVYKKVRAEEFKNVEKPEYIAEPLVPGETYTFSFRAHNELGWSENSPMSRKIKCKAGVPDAIERPSVKHINQTEANLTWLVPFSGGQEISSFHLYIKGGKFKSFNKKKFKSIPLQQLICATRNPNLAPGQQVAHHLTNLSPGHAYRFRISAANNFGPGPWSKPSYSAETSQLPQI